MLEDRTEDNNSYNYFYKKRMWNQARKLLRKKLIKEPNDHWLLTRIASTYYEEGRNKLALRFALKAYSLNGTCPLVNWDLAIALSKNNEVRKAIALLEGIIDRDIHELAYGECGEGYNWALALKNDSLFVLGNLFSTLNENKKANACYEEYIENRSTRKIKSIYDLRFAKKKLYKLCSRI